MAAVIDSFDRPAVPAWGPPVNLNPTFEAPTGGYTVIGSTAARSTAQAHEGTTSYLVTPDGSFAAPRIENWPVPVEGAIVAGSAWVRPTTANKRVVVAVHAFDASGTYLLTRNTVTVAATAGAWMYVETGPVSFTDVPGAARYAAMVGLENTGGTPPAVTDTFYVDQVELRAPAGGWGRTETDQQWLASGAFPYDFFTTGTVARHNISTRNTSRHTYVEVGKPDVDLVCKIAVPTLATGGLISVSLMGRRNSVGTSYYSAELSFETSQAIILKIHRVIGGVFTTLRTVITGLTHTTGGQYWLRFQLRDALLRSKAWLDGAFQPVSWTAEASDTTVAIGDYAGIRTSVPSSNTNALPIPVSVDDFKATSVDQPTAYPSRQSTYLLVTDKNLNVVGDPIYCWDSLDVTLRFNEVSTGMFTCPAYPWIREMLAPGNRVVVIRNGQIFAAGPWERRLVERSDEGENSGVGKLTVDFADDLSLIVSRNAYPKPALTPETQDTDFWEYSGNSELVLQNLVNASAGPGAQAIRRIPRLVIAGPTGVGSNVSGKLRLDQLGDGLRSIALAGGNIGFRTRQVGADIVFETYGTRDLSNSVRFGFGLNNLRYLAYEESAPAITTAIVGGQGEGSDRFLISRTDAPLESVWGRRETYVARPGSAPRAELDQAGDEAVAREAATARLQSSAWDTEDQRYGVHYGLGDRVSIEVGPGEQVSDLVRLVHLQAWSTAGELVSAMVGGQDASTDPQWIYRLREMNRRLGRLERTALPATPTA